MIRIRRLTKRFARQPALLDVDLEIGAGDALALWGPNGAGKSTLIRCVLGLLAFEGEITVGGHDVRRDGKAARRLVGYVPQELGFYDDLRVAEAVRLFARLKGVPIRGVGAVLDGVRLGGQERKRIRELSGGMKQRLALAIALLGEPPILVLDEVTASLDACGRREFTDLLGGLATGGRTLLFASHRVEEISALARRVAELEAGRVTAIVDGGDFMQRLGVGSVLHLTVASPQRASAFEALRTNGFAPRMNGVGVLVPVPSSQKAAPFRVLADARIAVEDFELVSTERASALAEEMHR
ncbi:MAG: ABC transporter ATP-binding protein [Phycisphaerae bacterium]|nr:ABC transporter ATP-binding protein [Phycisphaerae bacterium]